MIAGAVRGSEPLIRVIGESAIACEHPSMRSRVWILPVTCAVACAAACSRAPNDASTLRARPDAPSETAQRRRDAWRKEHDDAERVKELVLAELQEPGLPEWAGVYGQSLGYGHSQLFIAPRSGFAYFSKGCIWDEASSGRVVVSGDVLELPDVDEASVELARELVPVRVDPARHLLTPRLAVMACNEWNQGRLWTGGFTHESYESEHVRGPLRVPAKYQKYVLDEPIVGRVVRAWVERVPTGDGETFAQTRIGLDVGTDRRALEGMSFLVSREDTTPPDDVGEFIVEAVCEAGLLELGSVYADSALPEIGARATTGSR